MPPAGDLFRAAPLSTVSTVREATGKSVRFTGLRFQYTGKSGERPCRNVLYRCKLLSRPGRVLAEAAQDERRRQAWPGGGYTSFTA